MAIIKDIQGLSLNQLLCLRKLAVQELRETKEVAAALKNRQYIADIDTVLWQKKQSSSSCN